MNEDYRQKCDNYKLNKEVLSQDRVLESTLYKALVNQATELHNMYTKA
jgi:hypothetical protein